MLWAATELDDRSVVLLRGILCRRDRNIEEAPAAAVDWRAGLSRHNQWLVLFNYDAMHYAYIAHVDDVQVRTARLRRLRHKLHRHREREDRLSVDHVIK